MEWTESDGLRLLTAKLPGASAVFTTRLGGVSEGDFASLNLGVLTDDDEDTVRENRRLLTTALRRDPNGVLLGFQEHASAIARREWASDPNGWLAALVPEPADGQATANPDLTPLVQVADCLPVALAGAGGVAMLHCGWRGLADGIVAKGVAEVGATAAAVGPGIGPCCFEVGPEVLQRFAHLGDGVVSGRMLNLHEVTRRLLAAAGVEDVEVCGLCTSCEDELFFSHRRDRGRTGRQAGLVWRERDA
ncbi:MAG TPA: polyphenol oxidase family protein [Solirubrobacterales bacterium]|nr:polyphenol oxidase family protein [Solirubrobacterales bacterium]